ncbi:MAG TPA: hypothetical protein ENF78_00610 [Candidatus Bathyarchaeota archaeon]|nr:hypothetical protein [Candidatus Bathyarchaeota archaeon]
MPRLGPRVGLGRAAKVALLVAIIMVVGPMAGYFYIMDYVRGLSEQVHAEVKSMNIVVWEKKIAINTTVSVNNPSDFDVDITSVLFDIVYQGQPVGTGRSMRSFTLRPHSYQDIWLLILPNPGETFYRMLEGLMERGVWVTIDGTIHAQAYIFGLFTYNIDYSFSLRKKIAMELPLDIENIGDYITFEKLRVLKPGTLIEVILEVRNPLAEALEPLPFNITDLDVNIYINETYFGTGHLEEPVLVPATGSAEARLLVQSSREAMLELIEGSLNSRSFLMRAEGNVTIRMYNIEISRPIEYEEEFSAGAGTSLESLFDFTIRRLADLGVRGEWHVFEVWFDLKLRAPRTPVDIEMQYNITYFSMDIYDEKGNKVGYVELLEPIQAELANITRLAHAEMRVKESLFHRQVRGGERELTIAWTPRNVRTVIQVYELEMEMVKEELEIPELMGLQVVIGGVKMISPSALQRDRIITEAYASITNPTDFDIYLLSIGGQPAISFKIYCLEHGKYLGYGYLLENVTIRAKSTKGIAITVVIENTEHLRHAHRCGLAVCVSFWLKNGRIVFGFLGLVLTITFEVIMEE